VDVGGVFALPGEGLSMPPWLEILLDVLAFVGFIVIATFRRSPRRNDKAAPR
jgi:hypothetical protein